ncbi:MAG: hypothetical protein WCW31_04110 [Patescibacteria group bacterium]
MMFLHHTYHITSASRKLLTLVLVALVITSLNVQSARAQELLPQSPAFSTGTQATDDVNQGFTVPVTKAVAVTKTTIENKTQNVKAQSVSEKPQTSSSEAKYTKVVEMTAYTSSVEECDDTPFITADGSHTRWGIVASNFLPFGTKIRIPDYFGDQVFEVHDRMNKRFSNRVDVWMQTKGEAFQFGKRTLRIEVL